ncbi:hypothetical protein BGX26_011908 [Mortierella sp. AD094]|nr:hypothetical protein BGX26_011908 [Mortierella sp. AD094]
MDIKAIAVCSHDARMRSLDQSLSLGNAIANNLKASKSDDDNEVNISAAVVNKDCAQEAAQEVVMSGEELTKLEAAANKIQSVYRGCQRPAMHALTLYFSVIRSRQEVCGPELTAAQKWRHLIDFCQSEQIHKFHAKGSHNDNGQGETLTKPDGHPNENRARRAWRRAEFLGSRLGKGSSGVSSEEALVLLTEHWLEMSDHKHRYGSNLKPYHEYWLCQETSENFFYWLDKGDGKDVDLEDRPRARLDEQRVQYLQEHERAQYAVYAVNGLLYYKISGKPVHTLPNDVQASDDVDVSQVMPEANEHDDEATLLEKKRIRNKSKFIYVTDPHGTLYVAQKITPKSGHYRPRQRHFDRLLENLKEIGVSLADVKISYGVLETNGLGTAAVEGPTTHVLSLVAPLENKGVDQGVKTKA